MDHVPASLLRQAISATLHCLIGCALGEVVGMVVADALGLAVAPSIALAMGLAFFFGYALTARSVLRVGIGVRRAIGVALAADTVSILVMEVIDNAFILAVPGAIHAGVTSVLFWGALAIGFVIAFAVTVPVNRALIARGKGHGVAHAYHHGGPAEDGQHADHPPAR